MCAWQLLRMLKLARVFKASRVLQRVLMDVVTNQWEWTYAVMKMIKLIIILTIYAHWQVRWLWQGRTGQGRAGRGRAGRGRAGQGRAGRGRAGQGRAVRRRLWSPPQLREVRLRARPPARAPAAARGSVLRASPLSQRRTMPTPADVSARVRVRVRVRVPSPRPAVASSPLLLAGMHLGIGLIVYGRLLQLDQSLRRRLHRHPRAQPRGH